ncbi:hypothetical protein NDU88_001773 [Pleurodeles waltl]|uniref:Uncharacterized protein n=1 Tax=Pleurodeles waltl TaxID=8319 RepID=A0AAV7TJA2_PLEWA|nr:hypothetical protein NDU88_001773 [Pleurodeles waltl]
MGGRYNQVFRTVLQNGQNGTAAMVTHPEMVHSRGQVGQQVGRKALLREPILKPGKQLLERARPQMVLKGVGVHNWEIQQKMGLRLQKAKYVTDKGMGRREQKRRVMLRGRKERTAQGTVEGTGNGEGKPL